MYSEKQIRNLSLSELHAAKKESLHKRANPDNTRATNKVINDHLVLLDSEINKRNRLLRKKMKPRFKEYNYGID